MDNVLVWGSDIEPGTIEQASMASRLPFLAGHLALMPDAHIGMGATIGSVIPTQGAIIPSAIGVDIGCGMIAVETDLTVDGLPESLDGLHSCIASVVPSGVGKGFVIKDRLARDQRAKEVPTYTGASALTDKQVTKITDQFGSLGSGNHFVEVCLDERDRVWVVLHSGSRGIGNQLATAHIKRAKGLMRERFIDLEDPDLAYLVEGEPAFQAYIADMLWAQDYARANRDAMMDAVLTQLWGFVGTSSRSSGHEVGKEVQRINCHHNYTEREHHMGKDVWLTRKGAIRARVGDMGVIPGSMGTSSYIVSGLGNPSSYNSCSHGAGRRLSRTVARKTLTVESLRESMGDRVWNGTVGYAWSEADAKSLLDEHPDSYKDINQVMEDQSDLVKIEHSLHSVLNYKGT
jgi:tRNA-splicing ligase RtcB